MTTTTTNVRQALTRDPDLLTMAEAAELLGIHRDTAYQWAKAGLIPGAMKRRNTWRVSYPRLMNGLHGIPLPTEARSARPTVQSTGVTADLGQAQPGDGTTTAG